MQIESQSRTVSMGTGENNLRIQIYLDSQGLPTSVRVLTQRTEATAEHYERIAAAIKEVREKAEGFSCRRGVCADHGYYDREGGKFGCFQCDVEDEQAKMEEEENDAPNPDAA